MPIDRSQATNPGTGLLYKNPTRTSISEASESQSEIVDAINDIGAKKGRFYQEYDLEKMDKEFPPMLHGILKVREMDEEEAMAFGKTLARSKPSIFKIHISLGRDYPQMRMVSSPKAALLNGNKPRWGTEVGEAIGSILADKSLNVVELVYTVNSTEPFSSSVEIYGVDREAYENDEYFIPEILIDFVG